MNQNTDLDAYLERIGYDGPKTASIDTLRKLHKLHPQAIAFENINPLLRIPVQLDKESLQKKLVHGERGGYCFEHNLLLQNMLEQLGFTVRGLAARILWNTPEGRITSRGHMLLLVEVERRKYVADVGFGGLTLTAPLLLEPDLEQETPHEPYRLVRAGKQEYVMEARVRDEYKALYRFDLQEQFLPDYEVTNWYLSNHPESHFVTGLIAARSDTGRRYVLRNNEFSIHDLNKGTVKRYLDTADEILEVLEANFLLTLPEDDGLDQKLSQLIEQRND